MTIFANYYAQTRYSQQTNLIWRKRNEEEWTSFWNKLNIRKLEDRQFFLFRGGDASNPCNNLGEEKWKLQKNPSSPVEKSEENRDYISDDA